MDVIENEEVNEKIKICQDITAVLNCEGPGAGVLGELSALPELAQRLQRLISRQEEECKNCVAELVCKKARADEASTRLLREITAVEDELRQIEQEALRKAQKKDMTLKQLEERRLRLQFLKEEEARLKAEKTRLGNTVAHELPLLSQLMKLYVSATKVKFLCDSSTPSEVKGFVSNPGSILPFSFNTNDLSRASIVSHLWDMMEEPW